MINTNISKVRAETSALSELVRDGRRFIMYHKWAIETSPLQAYVSALIFSPACSLIRCLSKKEEPTWIRIQPDIGDKWSACLQTLEGHGSDVLSVAYSHDSARLASASYGTVRIWDTSSGECLQKLEGCSPVSFSQDFSQFASGLYSTVRIWDTNSGKCLQTFEGHSDSVHSIAFSHNSALLASASSYEKVKIWDTYSGKCLQTIRVKCTSPSTREYSTESSRVSSRKYWMFIIWDPSIG